MADCATILATLLHDAVQIADMLAKDIVVSACIQATETEHAARIQATATRQAGFMSLIATIIGALSALIAGGLAYRAATTELRIANDEKNARKRAYQRLIVELILNVRAKLKLFITSYDETPSEPPFKDYMSLTEKFAVIDLLTGELAPQNFERHSLLDDKAWKKLKSSSSWAELFKTLMVRAYEFRSTGQDYTNLTARARKAAGIAEKEIREYLVVSGTKASDL